MFGNQGLDTNQHFVFSNILAPNLKEVDATATEKEHSIDAEPSLPSPEILLL